MSNEYIWPEVFKTGILNRDGEHARAAACADGLCGWANCHAGANPIPENFGKGMAAVGAFLGVTPTPDGLMAYSAKILKEPGAA